MHPLVPVVAAFLSGAALSGLYEVSYRTAFILGAISFIPFFISYATKRPFRALLIVPPFFFIGAAFVIPYIRPVFPAEHIINLVREKDYSVEGSDRSGMTLEGIVESLPEFTGERTRLYVSSKRAHVNGVWRDTEGMVLLTVQGRADFDTGDQIRFTARLREPYNYGNPGEFDYKGYLKLKSIFVTGFIKDPSLVGLEKRGEAGFIEKERKRIGDFIDASGLETRGILKALIISDQAEIDPGVREAFNRTGTTHILSISGLHVGIVALFSYTLILLALKRSERLMLKVNVKKAAVVLSLLPVWVYGMVAGLSVATERSVIMVAAFVITLALNRGRDFLNTLALSALIILLVSPYSLWDVSFQLSFAAVASIIYMVPRLEKMFAKAEKEKDPLKKGGLVEFLSRVWAKKIRPSVFVTLAAGAGTAPILAYNFHMVSLWGLGANLAAVPLTALITPLMFVSAILSAFSVSIGMVFLRLSDLVLKALLLVVKGFAALPYSSVWVTTPTPLELMLFYSLLFFAANFGKKRLFKYGALIAVACLALDWGYYSYPQKSGELKVTFISVGQGESEFVELPDGRTMLIDGGGVYSKSFDIGEKVVAPFLWKKKIKEIDYLVLSHAQRDHMGGLKFIAENFNVKEFWWNGQGDLRSLKEVLDRKHIRLRTLDASAGRFDLGGVTVEVLHPSAGLDYDANNMCLVLRLTYGKDSFLFTGDIGADAEGELSKKDIRAEVLKVPHHGSRYSSSEEFLRAVNPAVAVISAGRYNVFRFPHPETLERYQTIGTRVYRTDIGGAVTVSTDGRVISAGSYLTGDAR